MKKIFACGLVMALLATGCSTGQQTDNSSGIAVTESQIEAKNDYYSQLKQQCKTKGNIACCLASINTMEEKMAKKVENNSCPTGFIQNQGTCIDSVAWCEPNDNLLEHKDVEWKTHTNIGYGFSFQYPASFALYTGEEVSHIRNIGFIPICEAGVSTACLIYIDGDYKNTNFEAAGVSVNILKSKNTETQCRVFENTEPNPTWRDRSINGRNYFYAELGDAATGHYSKTHSYRTFMHATCIEINARIAATNMGVYEPNTQKEFNETAVWYMLEEVVNSFEIPLNPIK